MEGRLSMMGDAQTFWEPNLARLPLFITSQGELLAGKESSSLKGDSEFSLKKLL